MLKLTHVQHLALSLVEPHVIRMVPVLQLDHALLDGIPSIRSVNGSSLMSFANLLEVHLLPFSMSLFKPLNSTVPNMDIGGTPLVIGVNKDTEPLTITLWEINPIQPTPHPPKTPCIKSSLQSRGKDVVETHVKCLTQTQIGDVHSPSFIH